MAALQYASLFHATAPTAQFAAPLSDQKDFSHRQHGAQVEVLLLLYYGKVAEPALEYFPFPHHRTKSRLTFSLRDAAHPPHPCLFPYYMNVIEENSPIHAEYQSASTTDISYR